MNTLRSLKFNGTALFDYFATIIVVFIITYFTSVPLSLVTIIIFIISILFHYVLYIFTFKLKMLFFLINSNNFCKVTRTVYIITTCSCNIITH